jgi:hypothetical protein
MGRYVAPLATDGASRTYCFVKTKLTGIVVHCELCFDWHCSNDFSRFSNRIKRRYYNNIFIIIYFTWIFGIKLSFIKFITIMKFITISYTLIRIGNVMYNRARQNSWYILSITTFPREKILGGL